MRNHVITGRDLSQVNQRLLAHPEKTGARLAANIPVYFSLTGLVVYTNYPATKQNCLAGQNDLCCNPGLALGRLRPHEEVN